MVGGLSSALDWYQKKIGTYDKQSWEKTVDQRILRGVCAVPKKVGRIKTELIDVDLVRGSAFPKAKPQHNWIAATISGVIKVALLPFYFTWWHIQTNALVSCILTILYFLQIFSIYLFYWGDEDFTDVPTSEVLTPAAMMLILGILHSQIVSTFTNKCSHKCVARTNRKRLKHKVQMKSSATQDMKSSETASDDKADSSIHDCSDVSCDEQSATLQHTKTSTVTSQNKKGNEFKGSKSVRKCNTNVEISQDGTDVCHPTESNGDSVVSSNEKECLFRDSGCSVDNCNNANASRKLVTEPCTNIPKVSCSSTCLCHENDNASSDEEYFVPRKTSYSKENWEKYVLEMKNNKSFNHKKEYHSKKHCLKCNDIIKTHYLSDMGPANSSSSHSVKSSLVRNCGQTQSEDGFKSSLIDSSEKNCGFLQLNCNTCRLSGLNFLEENVHHHKELPNYVQLPINIDRQYCSSCDSGPDTASHNTSIKPRTSDLDWPLITNIDSNSDSSDSSSDCSHDDRSDISPSENPFAWEMQESVPASISVGCPGSDKGSQSRAVSCTIWERNECKKVDLSVLDISSAIISKVDSSVPSSEYLAVGVLFAAVISFLPLLFRLQSGSTMESIQDVTLDVINFTVPSTNHVIQIFHNMLEVMTGSIWKVKSVVVIMMLERFTLSLIYFFLLSVAEKTFKQRLLYAKHFCYLTSSRRARRADLPHFRLNKVRNIKTWLSVRSYLKKIGPQRSVDVIVSIAFILEVCVLSFLCVQLLKETGTVYAMKLHCWEALLWTLALGVYILRFMIIGSKINKKYRNLSVLITEQINLYLHMEQKPHKKDELMLANSVLKLAADLLKELESPFKISGLCANPYLYNFIKVVVLSAFSGVLTEILGFKLKLYKIKIK